MFCPFLCLAWSHVNKGMQEHRVEEEGFQKDCELSILALGLGQSWTQYQNAALLLFDCKILGKPCNILILPLPCMQDKGYVLAHVVPSVSFFIF